MSERNGVRLEPSASSSDVSVGGVAGWRRIQHEHPVPPVRQPLGLVRVQEHDLLFPVVIPRRGSKIGMILRSAAQPTAINSTCIIKRLLKMLLDDGWRTVSNLEIAKGLLCTLLRVQEP